MQGTALTNRLSTKFVLITVALLTISGGIGFFVGKSNLDSLIDLNRKAEQAASAEIATLEKQLLASLAAEEALEVEGAEALNRGTLTEKGLDIETRKSFLRGKTEGALLIISSQLESILSPMPEEDREFFEANSDVYLEVLTDAKEINYFRAIDTESLDEVATDNELDAARKGDFAKAIEIKARAETPVVNILADEGIIRFVATIGPLENPFGVMEMVLDDSVTPLNTAAGKLKISFADELQARKKELAAAFEARKSSLETQKQAAARARANRIREADTVGTGAQTSHGLIVVVSTVFSAFVIGILVIAVITRPMSDSIDAMNKLAAGDLETEIPGLGRQDELGRMADAIQVFRENAIDRKRLEDEQGQLQEKAEAEKRAAMHKLADDFENSVSAAVTTVDERSQEILETALNMGGNIDKSSSSSLEVADASRATSEGVQATAAATTELSASIQEISQQSSESSRIATEAMEEAEAVNTRIQGLNAAADKIGEVVSLITDIAEQTNLLALNATIEAARAGEAGKGFAVVASEVKNLANQTGRATEEIDAQVKGIQSETRQSVAAIEGIAKTITRVQETVTAIASAVEEQGAVTHGIAENVERVRDSAEQMMDLASNVTQNSVQSYSAAIQVTWSAEDLNEPVRELHNNVDGFLATVRQV